MRLYAFYCGGEDADMAALTPLTPPWARRSPFLGSSTSSSIPRVTSYSIQARTRRWQPTRKADSVLSPILGR